jgi:L-aminopeptidase/D-esterase-like protein
VPMGAVGVGAGATVGKLDPTRPATRSGLGSASLRARGAIVAAVAVSNAVGDLVDPDTGALVAGCGLFGDVAALMERYRPALGTTTTLVAVVTDAPLTKAQANALSLAAHVGIARVTRPSHTISDGDTAFVASTGSGPVVDVGVLSIAVQEVVARALLAGARAVQASGA